MSEKDDDLLRTQLPNHIGGMFCAAASLIRKLDRHGMTIELLRESREAEMFRAQAEGFSSWLHAAAAATPDNVLPAEERRLLSYWLCEKER